MTLLVRAAGGVVFRTTGKGGIKILVAHRPQYDDWSYPKGKPDNGETPEETAVREVLEETGYHCRIVQPVGTTRYQLGDGIKEVMWFAMRPLPDSPGFEVNQEVDEIKWISRKKAAGILSYEHDRELLTNMSLGEISQTGTLHLLRHAAAGSRSKWNGDDRHRPLTNKGHRQAEAIADRLAGTGIERIVTSPYARCVQTVEPLAAQIGADVELSDALAEGPDVDAAYELVDSLVGHNTVLCSHGDVIPATVKRMMWAGLTLDSRLYCSKGSTWQVDVVEGRFDRALYIPPPGP